MAAESVEAEFAGEVFLSPEEKTVGIKKVRADITDQTVQMVGVHHEEIAPGIQPIFVEKRITLKPDPEKFPVDLVGILDLVDDKDFIRDNKTASKKPNADAVEKSQQLSVYALLFRALTGRKESGVTLDTVVRTTAGKISTEIQTSTRDGADIERVKRRMEIALLAIKSGIFPPTNPSNWICSERWCGYWSICPFGNKGGSR